MSSIHSISPEKLARRIGVPHCPALIDVRGADTARFDLAPEAARFSAAPAAAQTVAIVKAEAAAQVAVDFSRAEGN